MSEFGKSFSRGFGEELGKATAIVGTGIVVLAVGKLFLTCGASAPVSIPMIKAGLGLAGGGASAGNSSGQS